MTGNMFFLKHPTLHFVQRQYWLPCVIDMCLCVEHYS